jgi:hypothetical protein
LWPWDGRPFAAPVVIARSVEPARRKRYSVCDELFYFTANLVVHAFCCFSLSKLQSLRWCCGWKGNDSRGRLRTVMPYHF